MTSILCLPDELIDIVFSLLPPIDAIHMTHCCVELYRPHHVYRSAKRTMGRILPNFLDLDAIFIGGDIYKIFRGITDKISIEIYIPLIKDYARGEVYLESDEFKDLEHYMQAIGGFDRILDHEFYDWYHEGLHWSYWVKNKQSVDVRAQYGIPLYEIKHMDTVNFNAKKLCCKREFPFHSL